MIIKKKIYQERKEHEKGQSRMKYGKIKENRERNAKVIRFL